MPEYLLGAPFLDLVEQEVEVVPEEHILHLVVQVKGMGMVVLGKPTLPLLER